MILTLNLVINLKIKKNNQMFTIEEFSKPKDTNNDEN